MGKDCCRHSLTLTSAPPSLRMAFDMSKENKIESVTIPDGDLEVTRLEDCGVVAAEVLVMIVCFFCGVRKNCKKILQDRSTKFIPKYRAASKETHSREVLR